MVDNQTKIILAQQGHFVSLYFTEMPLSHSSLYVWAYYMLQYHGGQ